MKQAQFTHRAAFLLSCQSASYKVLQDSKQNNNTASNQSTPADEYKQHHQRQ